MNEARTDRFEPAAKSVAIMRFTNHFCDDESEPGRIRRGSRQDVKREARTTNSRSFPNYASVIGARGHPMLRRQHDNGEALGRELFATLAAARCQNGAASTSAHAKSKAVFLCAAAVIRLECSLAHEYLRLVSTWFPHTQGSFVVEIDHTKLKAYVFSSAFVKPGG